MSANKPQYAVGAKASITLKPKAKAKQASWTLPAGDEDDELLDEDELLTEEDRQRPAAIGETGLTAHASHSVHLLLAAGDALCLRFAIVQQSSVPFTVMDVLLQCYLALSAALDDCEIGAGKKACKNCTCGRADAEAAVQKVDLSQDMIENPQSACGSVSPCQALLLPSTAQIVTAVHTYIIQARHCCPAEWRRWHSGLTDSAGSVL